MITHAFCRPFYEDSAFFLISALNFSKCPFVFLAEVAPSFIKKPNTPSNTSSWTSVVPPDDFSLGLK